MRPPRVRAGLGQGPWIAAAKQPARMEEPRRRGGAEPAAAWRGGVEGGDRYEPPR